MLRLPRGAQRRRRGREAAVRPRLPPRLCQGLVDQTLHLPELPLRAPDGRRVLRRGSGRAHVEATATMFHEPALPQVHVGIASIAACGHTRRARREARPSKARRRGGRRRRLRHGGRRRRHGRVRPEGLVRQSASRRSWTTSVWRTTRASRRTTSSPRSSPRAASSRRRRKMMKCPRSNRARTLDAVDAAAPPLLL